MARFRHQPSGAANRSRAKERAKAHLAAGQLTLKFPVRAADLDPLMSVGDLSEDDLTDPIRLAAAQAELLPDMVKRYAGRLEEPRGEPATLYRFELPGSRTRLGEETLADREIVRHEIRRQAFELVWWDSWLELIAPTLATGKTVQEVLTLEQLRAM